MKILHCSDLHLGRRPVGSPDSLYSKERYKDFFKAFEYVISEAIERDVDIFIVSGDFFDKKDISPKNLEDAQGLIKKLIDRKMKILLIEGNHDRTFFQEKSWVSFFDSFENVFFIDSVKRTGDLYEFIPFHIEGIDFYGVNYFGSNTDEILALLAESLEGDKNFIVTHTCIGNGEDFFPGLVKSETLDLFKDRVIYIAGGHIHSKKTYPSGSPFFFVPGSLEYWDIAESGEKGFFILDTSSKKVEYFSVLERIRKKIRMDYTVNEKFSGEFEEKLFFEIDKKEIPNGCLFVLNILTDSHDFSVDVKKIENYLMEKGVLKAFISVKRKTEDFEFKDYSQLSEEEIVGEIIKNSGEWVKYREKSKETLRALKMMKNYQQRNDEESFIEEIDSLFERILEDKKNDNR